MNMRQVHDNTRAAGEQMPVDSTKAGRVLHRIADVCRQQSLSARVLIKRMAATRHELIEQLSPSCDLKLSQLYKWQMALDVPMIELLVTPGQSLSPEINRRAQLVKLMKTARSMQDLADSDSLKLLTTRLADELTDIMPELANVDAWPAVGKRRTLNEVSGIEQRMLPDSVLDRSRLPLADGD